MADAVDKANEIHNHWLQKQLETQASNSVAITVTDTCIDCGVTISVQRKKALPHAIRCIDCQREYEHINK